MSMSDCLRRALVLCLTVQSIIIVILILIVWMKESSLLRSEMSAMLEEMKNDRKRFKTFLNKKKGKF